MRKAIAVIGTLLLVTLMFSMTIFASSSPNYGAVINWERDGYVQCQPSYIENGNHAARAWLTTDYYPSRSYTVYGTSKYDSNIYSRQRQIGDIYSIDYGFEWIPTDSSYWPVSGDLIK